MPAARSTKGKDAKSESKRMKISTRYRERKYEIEQGVPASDGSAPRYLAFRPFRGLESKLLQDIHNVRFLHGLGEGSSK